MRHWTPRLREPLDFWIEQGMRLQLRGSHPLPPKREAGTLAARSYGLFEVTVADQKLRFHTQPGVFSADGPDEGSLLLLDAVLPVVKPHMVVLDLGSGVGLIGLALAGLLARGEVWMVDPDVRAHRLAIANVELNRVSNAHAVLGDITLDLPPRLRFDLVVSNPPTHSGKEVLAAFVDESYRMMKPGGRMFVVVNRLLSIRAMMGHTFGDVEQVARKKGFVVLRAQKARRPHNAQRISAPKAVSLSTEGATENGPIEPGARPAELP